MRRRKKKEEETYQREHHARADERAPDDGHDEVQAGLQGPAVEQQPGRDERARVDDGHEAVLGLVPAAALPLGPPHREPVHDGRAEGDARREAGHQARVDETHRAGGEGVFLFEDCWEGC